jgi:hypothetical protein
MHPFAIKEWLGSTEESPQRAETANQFPKVEGPVPSAGNR